jgi:uncharacterized protein
MLVRELRWHECLDTLAHARLARLACASGPQPYVVPVYLVYHDPFLYGFTTPGQKVEWMRANPRVCVEFDDVRRFDDWTSVIVVGRYEELPDGPEGREERLRAHASLRPYEGWWQPACAAGGPPDPAAPFQAIYYRIRIDRVTGRRAQPTTSP